MVRMFSRCFKNLILSFCSSKSCFSEWMKKMGGAEMRRSSMSFAGTLSCVRYLTICSMARTPAGVLTEAILNEMRQCLWVTMMRWRDLRLSTKIPKIHGLEDHLIPMIEE
jgi:hypothetical protein